jgi:hypothetical protein
MKCVDLHVASDACILGCAQLVSCDFRTARASVERKLSC